MSNTSRLFFALWPDTETRQALSGLCQAIGANEFKWVQTHNLHVTLVFLGHVGADSEILLKQSVNDITVQPFALTFDCLSYWSKPKILCLTCRKPVQDDCRDAGGTTPWMGEVEQCMEQLPRATHGAVAEALTLVSALEAAAVSCGLHIDTRPYIPHITLARHARYLPDVKIEPLVWSAEAFCLVESCSEPDGVCYKVLQQWPFIKLTANPGE